MEKKKQHPVFDKKKGNKVVHEQITEAYQSGVIDRMIEKPPHEEPEQEK